MKKDIASLKNFTQIPVFDNRFIEVKSLYLSLFGRLPDINYIGQVDGEKAYQKISTQFADSIVRTHTYRWYEKKKKKYRFDRTVVVFNNNCVLEFNEECIEVLHDDHGTAFLEQVTQIAYQCRERSQQRKAEVSLIVKGYDGLELKPMEIKKTRLDIGLYYEDDFAPVDDVIRKRLNRKNDKGIVLLHGLPGTGKTTYLRYLIGKVNKKVLFLSADVAANIMDPGFIQLLIDHPDSVIIIEDAEHIIADRRNSNSSAVSNLLNVSDGLLADFLNVQLICTFNCPLTMVDSALLRKGRLIASYEFGKLSVEKASRLREVLGIAQPVTDPMTIAEITHPQEIRNDTAATKTVIGFRRQVEEQAC